MNDRPPWQFRLSHLFELMTLSALAAAIAGACGLGTLLLFAGGALAWANWRGGLQPLQSGQWQMILLGLAWNLFLISLILPSVHVFGPVAGWGAAWWALISTLDAIRKGEFAEPALLLHLGINLANLLMALMPAMMWRIRHGRGQWMSAALCVAMVVPWCVGVSTPMLPGYYVWCAAFYLAPCALPIRAGSFAAMVVLAIFLGIANEFGWLH